MQNDQDIQVKICGLTRAQDVECAIENGADYLGFIIEANSPRRLSVQTASAISRPAQGLANIVALTVNPSDDLIDKIAQTLQPDFIQLHGNESATRLAQIRERISTGIKLIKVIKISSRDDLEQIALFRPFADLLLLDAKPPKGSAQQGGHGTAFDWSILKGLTDPSNIMLAGGLGPHNIVAAKTATHKIGLKLFDVSSGVEARAGVKDPSLIQSFIQIAKGRTAKHDKLS